MRRFVLKRASVSVLFFSLLLLICMSGAGCASSRTSDANTEQDNTAEEAVIKKLDVTVTENRDDELVFDISMDDFIDSYNSLYQCDHHEPCMPPSYKWDFYNVMAIHSDYEVLCYRFSQDESIRSIPSISVYVPVNDDYIQQIMLSYDDHSYSIPTYEMYEEMCFYTLKVMLPELSDDKLTEVYAELNDIADENITDTPYSAGAVPFVLYHKDGIGLYPYYAIGEELHFCVIPVTRDSLESFEKQGVIIHEITT